MSLLNKIRRRFLGEPKDYWLHQVPSPILRRIKPGGSISVIDLGAHNGDFTRVLSTQYRITRGILVEPLPNLAEKLRFQFSGPTYSVLECVISDHEGSETFERNEAEETSSILKINRDHPALAAVAVDKSETITVRSRTLDDVVEESGLEKIDLIKIDVQGAEDKVLPGAAKTLARTNAIWIEVSFKPLYEGSATYPEIYLTLDRDFRLMDMQPAFRAPDGEILQSDILFLHR